MRQRAFVIPSGAQRSRGIFSLRPRPAQQSAIEPARRNDRDGAIARRAAETTTTTEPTP